MAKTRRQRVLESAHKLFLHFGFQRTTLVDIARESHVSRPTLYSMYDGKEQIFAAVMDYYADKLLTEIRTQTEKKDDLFEILNIFFEVAVHRPFEQMSGTTFYNDLFELSDDRIRESLLSATERFHASLTGLLKKCDQSRLQKTGMPPELLSRVLLDAVHGIKDKSQTAEQLRTRVTGLVKLTCLAVTRPPSP